MEPNLLCEAGSADADSRSDTDPDTPLCGACSYDLRSLGDWPIKCPECGVVNEATAYVSSKALASHVFFEARAIGISTTLLLLFTVFGLLATFGAPCCSFVPAMLIIMIVVRSFTGLRALLGRRAAKISFIGIAYGVAMAISAIMCMVGAIGLFAVS